MICEHKVGALFIGRQTLVSCFLFSFLHVPLGEESEGGRRRSSGEWAESGAPHENASVSGLQQATFCVSAILISQTYFSIFYKAE